MARDTLSAVAVLCCSLACSGSNLGTTDANPLAPGDAERLVEVDATLLPGYTVTFGPARVASGEERTQCVVKRLGNTDPVRINRIHNVLGATSHHLIVYRVAETVEKPDPFDCDPFVDTLNPEAGSPLMITQKHEELLTLPSGVAFSLSANQLVRLEMHYINTGDVEEDVTASSTLIPIPDKDFREEADFLFVGNPDLKIPPGQKMTLGPSFFEVPSTLYGIQYFGITGHTHRYGTNVWVATSPSEGEADTPVYDVPDWKWSEPETVYHKPPFQIADRGGFRFSCSWDNTSKETLTLGESANDEMCFFWAYYYPSHGAKVCVHTEQLGAPLDICCPGSVLCKQVDQLLGK
jgi:hypothetical protein